MKQVAALSLKGASMEEAQSGQVAILMGTYNGGRYLTEQLSSIAAQNYPDWNLLVRDDGSTDDTVELLRQFAAHEPRVRLCDVTGGNRGACGNFATLMDEALKEPYRYFAFADQDDCWHPEKLTVQLDVMRELERDHPGVPLLVHSDLEVVDDQMRSLHPSLMRYQSIHHEVDRPLQVLLIQNFVTGCTMLANRPLLECACPVPPEAVLHDWWLALCAAVFGQMGYIDRSLVRYRQHVANAVGAKSLRSQFNPATASWYRSWQRGRFHLAQSMRQAEAMAKRVTDAGTAKTDLQLISSYAQLADNCMLSRIEFVVKHNVLPQAPLRKLLALSRLIPLIPKRDVV